MFMTEKIIIIYSQGIRAHMFSYLGFRFITNK